MSKSAMELKYQPTNIKLLQDIEKEKSILLVCSHYANWEWNVSLSMYLEATCYAGIPKNIESLFQQIGETDQGQMGHLTYNPKGDGKNGYG